jgi:hypothetical protein
MNVVFPFTCFSGESETVCYWNWLLVEEKERELWCVVFVCLVVMVVDSKKEYHIIEESLCQCIEERERERDRIENSSERKGWTIS